MTENQNIEAITSQLNQIQAQESELQSHFETDISQDSSLSRLGDKNSQTGKNLKLREEATQKAIKELTALKQVSEKVEDEGLRQSLNETASQVEQYLNDYQNFLEEENQYYQEIGEKDATIDTFEDTMAALNEKHVNLQNQLKNLESQLEKSRQALQDVQNKDQALAGPYTHKGGYDFV
ncbi:YkyA family protein [Aerococcus mictus]